MPTLRAIVTAAVLGAAVTAPAGAQTAEKLPCLPKPAPNYAPAPGDDAITARAKAIHARVFKIDTHVDIEPNMFRPDANNYCTGIASNQVDLLKMEEGGLDAIFMSIYVGHGLLDPDGYARSYASDTAKFNAVHRFAEQIAPDRVGIAYTAADARRIFASGRKVLFMGVENGEGIGEDITRVKEFYDRGGRYMSLAHNGHSQLSDSNTGEANDTWLWHGLSPLGKKVIVEMNRVGMMIDISHPSKESMMQTLAITRAPIIASHSGVRALCNHSRNLDDEQLRALAKNGGVAQMVAFRTYVNCNPLMDSLRTAATNALYQEYGITLPAAAGRGNGGGGGNGRGGAGAGAAGGRGTPPVAGTGAVGTGAAGAAAAGGGRGNAAGGTRGGGVGGGGGGGAAGRGLVCGGATAQTIAGGGQGFGAARGGAGGRGNATTVAVDSQVAALSEDRRQGFLAKQQALALRYPATPTASVMDYADHIDYAVKIMGIDHVGLSSDFDGGGGIEGYNCALESLNVTRELVRRGYTEAQIAKLWSGNLLRVMEQVDAVGKRMRAAPPVKKTP